jgi:lipopolysaccharide/colanic/teichoic acid biosynthesis glycosyltransferase
MEAALSSRSNATVKVPADIGGYGPNGSRESIAGDLALRLIPTVDGGDRTRADIGPLPRERSEVASRMLNVVVATTALIAVAPILTLVAALVRVTSRGPVLYSQTRVGVDRRFRSASNDDRRAYDHGGKPFTMYKFRTMRVDAEPDGRAVWASQNDDRVTPIGAMLRRTRLDELPQLYNVLRGDMNIVGPRPERPSIFAELRHDIPNYHLRQRVKPGITGWAQVNQAYDTSIDDVRN